MLLKLYLIDIPHFREFFLHVRTTQVSVLVGGDILVGRTSISEAEVKAARRKGTYVDTDLTSQSPVCLTDVRVNSQNLYVAIF